MAKVGYRIKLHHSLVTPMMLAGVPRKFAIFNGTIGAAMVLGLHAFYMLPVCVGLHVVAMVLAKKDPYFFEIVLRHMKQKKFYGV
ncbi:MAG: VirB3 family type IV secretion system protein [Pseudomonadota bacterium]|nr:VirB3 family type IV secretion system protein [Gammaproteobacteria bacterium]MBU1558717.1 VirB3 family type IV secretion system protein [Gammaproteobacteria bacterium]MBU1628913.1 VirB3 family type IV secretion system protein [Gammaproteobacteria bacterium]MBU1926910.1 VirB3 family type IV secretion system protein [Gammaproteobacteria bacterium]MBU2545738.1 VirB3 family type IV secretion system protein [Gammaproteobacteria bacterium]